MLVVMGAAPFTAKDTIGVKPAGRAKKAAAAWPEALGLGHMARSARGGVDL